MSTLAQMEPYVGLRAYQLGDQDRFFGRRSESREVASLWLGNRLLILHGPSGAGKTSLIQAGVLPLVQEDAVSLPMGRVTRGAAVPSPPRDHNPYTFALLSSWSPAEPPARLRGKSVLSFLRERGERLDKYGDRMPLVAAIDRFEELFIDFAARWRFRDAFIHELATAVQQLPHLRLLISLRDEFLAKLLPHEAELAGGSRARFEVEPLSSRAALEAVEGPLRLTDRSFAPGVARELIDKLRTVRFTNAIGETTEVTTERLEPVELQVVCSALWRNLPIGARLITANHVRDYGDIEDTLANFCLSALATVAAEQAISLVDLQIWLERDFVTELGTRGVVYEGLSTTGGMPNTVPQALEDLHILKSEWRSESRWYELQHDRLIGPIRAITQNGLTEARSSPAFEADAQGYLRAAEGAYVDGEHSVAEQHAIEARRLATGDLRTQAEAESFLGKIALEDGRPEQGLSHFRQAAGLFEALQDRTAVGRLLATIGRALKDRGQYFLAITELQGAVLRLPGYPPAQLDLAEALLFSGQASAAIGICGSVLTVAPQNVDALALRAQIYADLGDTPAAVADLERLSALLPQYEDWPGIRMTRALTRSHLGRHEEAMADAQIAVAAAGDDGALLVRAARVAAAASSPGQAREWAQRAVGAAKPPLPYQSSDLTRLLRDE